MDGLGDERLRLMSQLMETLDDIEKESGIFLIKPMYSYKAKWVLFVNNRRNQVIIGPLG